MVIKHFFENHVGLKNILIIIGFIAAMGVTYAEIYSQINENKKEIENIKEYAIKKERTDREFRNIMRRDIETVKTDVKDTNTILREYIRDENQRRQSGRPR